MPHDATNISQLDLSDSDREDANHGKQLTICWMVHCVHDHALCQTQYYCFIWWCLRCLDTFAQAFNSMVFKTHVNDIKPTSMKSLAKIDPHDEKSLMTPHWHCKTERYGWWTRSTRGGTPTFAATDPCSWSDYCHFVDMWLNSHLTYWVSKTRITPKVKAAAALWSVLGWEASCMSQSALDIPSRSAEQTSPHTKLLC